MRQKYINLPSSTQVTERNRTIREKSPIYRVSLGGEEKLIMLMDIARAGPPYRSEK